MPDGNEPGTRKEKLRFSTTSLAYLILKKHESGPGQPKKEEPAQFELRRFFGINVFLTQPP